MVCKYILSITALLATPLTVFAEATIGNGMLTFPSGHAYQVERQWPESGVVCVSNQSGPRVCNLSAGSYKWNDWTDSTSGNYMSFSTVVVDPEPEPEPVDPVAPIDTDHGSHFTVAEIEQIVQGRLSEYLNEAEIRLVISEVLIDVLDPYLTEDEGNAQSIAIFDERCMVVE